MNALSRRNFTQSSLASITSVASAMALNGPLLSLYGQTSAKATGDGAGNPVGKRIRIGQIGTQHAHAAGKMETARKLPEIFEVVGVVEEDADSRVQASKSATYKDLPWMTTEQLLNVPGLQLVLVETKIDDLLPTAEVCLSAGCHIHLDKPAGTSLEQFRRVTEIARAKGRLIQMGYMFRSNPAFQFLYDALKQGWLGDVFEVDGVMSKKVSPADRAELAKYRGGSMFELGCHLIDAVVKVLGKPRTIKAANLQTHPQVDSLYDNCLAVFEYPRATATVRSSMVEVDGGRRRQLVVCGTAGTIEIEPLEPAQLTLTLDQARGNYRKGTQTVELPKSSGRYDGDLIALAAAIRGESTYEYSLEHDLVVQACVLEASEMLGN